MRKMSNRTKDKLTITALLLVVAIVLAVAVSAISRAFAQNIVDFYETDIYAYTTVEHAKYYEIKKFDKVAGKYLWSCV